MITTITKKNEKISKEDLLNSIINKQATSTAICTVDCTASY